MPSDEERQILKMVEAGRISAEEAVKLIKALEDSSVEMRVIGTTPAPSFGSAAGADSEKTDAPEFEQVARNARRLWQIPLWSGVLVTVLSAYWLYALVHASNFGFWLYCAWALLLFGVLLLALFAGSRTSRWLFVKVEQAGDEWPRNITFGFPLPLGPAAWLLRNFGHNFAGLRHTSVDEILEIITGGVSSSEPLIVNVDEGAGGEKVQIYIG